MTGVLAGCLAIDPIITVDEILKARAVIQETTDIPEPETLLESISETPTVVIT